jgi:hypothetical protein
VLFAAVALAWLCVALAVGTAKHAPLLTARIVGMVSDAESIELSIQVSNRTPHVHLLHPAKVETWSNAGWKTCPDGIVAFPQNDLALAGAAKTTCCAIKRFASGTHFRLVIEGQRPRSGLNSFLFRLQHRLVGRDHALSLNPLDPTPIMCADTLVTVASTSR